MEKINSYLNFLLIKLIEIYGYIIYLADGHEST